MCERTCRPSQINICPFTRWFLVQVHLLAGFAVVGQSNPSGVLGLLEGPSNIYVIHFYPETEVRRGRSSARVLWSRGGSSPLSIARTQSSSGSQLQLVSYRLQPSGGARNTRRPRCRNPTTPL